MRTIVKIQISSRKDISVYVFFMKVLKIIFLIRNLLDSFNCLFGEDRILKVLSQCNIFSPSLS